MYNKDSGYPPADCLNRLNLRSPRKKIDRKSDSGERKSLTAHQFLSLVVIFFAFWAGTTACNGNHSKNRIVLTGSSTVAPLASEMARHFESLHPDVRIDVQTGGSSRGIADARRGVADIGMVSRALSDEESDLRSYSIARDGIAIIVHKNNPITKLESEQIKSIYRGRLSNWSQVGGRDAPITVVNKADGHSTLGLFLAHFDLRSNQIKADVVIGDNEQGIKTVAGNPNAIGYVSIGTAEYDVSHGVMIKLLPLNGVAASSAHVRDGTFPLARPLNFVTKNAPQGLALAFIEFAQSGQVHDIIRQQYFVPLAL